ncbi:SCF ubiquitin ligase complex subunit cdc4 [Metarhizium rileyi]|uniref:SCF ubiquitin ligase complex subunit cdc4 n=1 Tax=Metarhizium rileyi (strain RCEF 4871) TaxID=1649241 RepID=A0A5C6GBN9_METRR|nr:SCF ubiquitin ligase complex subunit cdc4 [Metarhizium rileyi]
MTPSPLPSSQASEPRRPRSAPKVSVNIAEGSQTNSRRFQLQVSECVETKTVTTTTRLTRKFPQVFVRDPTPLEGLDTKEYPLAMKPTPPELLEFSYNVPEDDLAEEEHVYHDGEKDAMQDGLSQLVITKPVKQFATGSLTPTAVKTEPCLHQTPLPNRTARQPSRSPSEGYPRRTRQTRSTVTDSPSSSASQGVAGSVITPRTSQRLARSSTLHAVSDKLRRSITQTISNSTGDCRKGNATAAGMPSSSRGGSGFLATPDTSELVGSVTDRSSQQQRSVQPNPPRLLQDSSSVPAVTCDAASPTESDSHTVFSSNVATPPITDADTEPFADADADDSLQHSLRAAIHHRPTIDIVAAQDASLPSPRLSPTLAASQLHSTVPDDGAQSSFQTSASDDTIPWADGTQITDDIKTLQLIPNAKSADDERALRRLLFNDRLGPVVLDTQTILEAFDSMKTEMKTFMMYQFLRRCPRPTLRLIADTVNPALKCDFLRQLPLELSYHVLGYLDHRDLCRAARVSKHWRNIVDRNETGWKELLDREGYSMAPGELGKAIIQGWGWQDPVGPMGHERDLSMQSRLTSSEFELTRAFRTEIAPRSRSSKRKRGLNTYSAPERSKRRAGTSQDSSHAIVRDTRVEAEVRQHKSEGPLSAANAAAAAVPDPQLGLPSLRQLHLFKSIYRRHHMIRRSWISGEVKPGHVAFAAHPRHVITCLQFDDDKIITGSDDTLIHIYDTKTGKLRKKLEGHEGGVWALQYEGNVLVSGSTDRSVRVWDIERGLCQQVFYGHTSTVRCLQILMPTETGRDRSGQAILQPEKPLIITGSRDSQLRVWRLPEVGSRRYIQTGPPAQESDCPYFIRVLLGHTHSVRAISAYGDTLVSGSYDSTVRVWRISTGESLHVLRGHSQKVYSVVLDHKRNRCISGSMDSLVKIWDLATGACLNTLEGHTLLVGLLDLRDERLVSAAADSTLRVWDPENGRCRHTLMAHTGAITCFQHDGQKVISGSEKTVKMWDAKTGECVQDLLTDLTGVWQVKFDGRRCVAAVQRDQLTYVEILDFGAIRDGQPPEELGKRILLNEHEVQEIIEDGAV